MHIKFVREGGFAGIRLSKSIDLDEISEELADELKQLVKNCDFNKLPARIPSGPPMPDQFSYVVTVETDDWSHTVETGDMSAPESLRPLLERLSRLARSKLH